MPIYQWMSNDELRTEYIRQSHRINALKRLRMIDRISDTELDKAMAERQVLASQINERASSGELGQMLRDEIFSHR